MNIFFFFNDTATTEIYTLSLHDALPICPVDRLGERELPLTHPVRPGARGRSSPSGLHRSEEHTSELQSRQYLVCRLLLEKKKNYSSIPTYHYYQARSKAQTPGFHLRHSC